MKKIDNGTFLWDPVILFRADDTFPMAREPVLRRMPDGSLIALLYTGGPYEPHPENVVAAVRSEDDGAHWSRPEVIFQNSGRGCWGTEIFTDGDRPFLVFQTFRADTFYQELRSYIAFSDDSGRSWSAPESFHGVPSGFCVRQGRALADGSWLFPVYWQEVRGRWDEGFQDDGRWPFVSGVIRSSDRGGSWSLHGHCAAGAKFHAWEPEVIEIAPGRLRMFLRCESPERRLWESDSCDGGITWSAPAPGAVPNPGTKVVIYRVRDRWVMFNNDVTDGDRRCELAMWTSADGCQWRRQGVVARIDPPDCTGHWRELPRNVLPQIAYPHGFADDERECVYLALDGTRKHFFMKIPYGDIPA